MDPTIPLTKSELKRLSELEGVIDAGKETFLKVGLALATIRDERLYRTTHGSFEDYCQRGTRSAGSARRR